MARPFSSQTIMMITFSTITLLLIAITATAATTHQPLSNYYRADQPFQELYLEQRLNPFDPFDVSTFKQRYFLDVSTYKTGAPLCVYTGAEAPLEYYWHHSGGSFRAMCTKMSAAHLFIEHRMYGESFPDNFTPKAHMKYVLTEFAAEDAARLISHVKTQYFTGKLQLPTVTAGGSAAGMMAAFLRIRYPHLVHAAIASSAPFAMIGQRYTANAPLNTAYFKKVTWDYAQSNPKCPVLVEEAYAQLKALYTNKQFDKIRTTFNTCQEINTPEMYDHLEKWIRASFISFSQGNFPNDDPKRAYPVDITCKMLLAHQDDPLAGLASVVELDYEDPVMAQVNTPRFWRQNFEQIKLMKLLGTTPTTANSAFSTFFTQPRGACHDIMEEFVDCIDDTGCGTGIDGLVWDWQACTGYVYYQSCSKQNGCMFPAFTHDLNTHVQYCAKVWQTDARLDEQRLGFAFPSVNWTGTSNIYMTNGLTDPWCEGGIQHAQDITTLAINIPHESHHADLNAPTVNDPEALKYAREVMYDVVYDMLYNPHDVAKFTKHRNIIETKFPAHCYSNATITPHYQPRRV